MIAQLVFKLRRVFAQATLTFLPSFINFSHSKTHRPFLLSDLIFSFQYKVEMDTFLILMMFVGSKSSVAVDDSIDGDLLAYQLKIIKEIIGVNALQVKHIITQKTAKIYLVAVCLKKNSSV